MIREVTYYQAVCDLCGAVDDGGEFSAWSDLDGARMAATDRGWAELEVPLPRPGRHDYVHHIEGREPIYLRIVLICHAHGPGGIDWCGQCEGNLDDDAWKIGAGGDLMQRCPTDHLVTLALEDR